LQLQALTDQDSDTVHSCSTSFAQCDCIDCGGAARRALSGPRHRNAASSFPSTGVELPAKAFAKEARINPDAVVENKLLSHTLSIIETAQLMRDENRLASKRMTDRGAASESTLNGAWQWRE
jgi:hypothetical protein